MHIDILNTILNLLLGGGLLVTLVTLKSTKRKAASEADTIAIDNTAKLSKLWEEFADFASARNEENQKLNNELRDKVASLTETVNLLNREVAKLTRMLKEAKKCKEADNCPVLKKQQLDEN